MIGISPRSELEGTAASSWDMNAVRHPASPTAWELDLVRRIRTGDQIAFKDLLERYQSKVFSTIYAILRNRSEAEDIAQEVFAKVYFGMAGFGFRSSLATWIHKITINECYGRLRKERSQKRDGQIVAIEDNATAPAPSVGRISMLRDLANKLLMHLSEDDRLLLILKEVEGHSIQELAEMTRVTENTVKVRLYRARQRLLKFAQRLSVPRGRFRSSLR